MKGIITSEGFALTVIFFGVLLFIYSAFASAAHEERRNIYLKCIDTHPQQEVCLPILKN